MWSVCFPKIEMLRLAVSRNLFPAEWLQRTVAWAMDGDERLWMRFLEAPPRSLQERLARLGAVWYRESPPLKFQVAGSWAEILPLEPSASEKLPEIVLLEIAFRYLPTYLKSRTLIQNEIRLVYFDETHKAVWCLWKLKCRSAMESWALKPGVKIYIQQAEQRWVEWGYRHPLIEYIPPPPRGICVIDTSKRTCHLNFTVDEMNEQETINEFLKVNANDQIALHTTVPLPSLSLRLRWRQQSPTNRPTLWFLDATACDAFRHRCQEIDPLVLESMLVAPVCRGDVHGLVVWDNSKDGATSICLPPESQAYVADEEIPGLFWPIGWRFYPEMKASMRAELAGLEQGVVVWWERSGDYGAHRHRVPINAFQQLKTMIEYVVPSGHKTVRRLWSMPSWCVRWQIGIATDGNQLSPDSVVPEAKLISNHHRGSRIVNTHHTHNAKPCIRYKANPDEQSWMRICSRWLQTQIGRWRQRWRKNRLSEQATVSHLNRQDNVAKNDSLDQPNLVSPEALMLGPRAVVRQRELYEQLLAAVTTEDEGKHRAECWAELARWQRSAGRLRDAALCWLMAVWENTEGNARHWQDEWWHTELRLARLPSAMLSSPEFWRQSSPRVAAIARTAAAYLVHLAGLPKAEQNAPQLLSALLAVIERHGETIPVRACWLAVVAVSRWCGGDALLLARWADRLLARLTTQASTVYTDFPNFLRFRDSRQAHYVAAAGAWLTRQRQSVIDWIRRHPTGPLRKEGLDGERETTAQVAQLLLAWGLAAVGECQQAFEWCEATCHTIAATQEEEIGHALQVLVQLMRIRIQEISDGRRPHPWPMSASPHQRQLMSPAARYAVDRLCEHCRILDPFRLIRPLRQWELAPLRTAESLGGRLILLLESKDAQTISDEAEQLLLWCRTTRDHAGICRVVVAICEIAALLPPPLLDQLITWLPLVWQKLPMHWPDPSSDRSGLQITSYLRSREVCCRMFENVIRVMTQWPTEAAGPCLSGLWEQWLQYGAQMAEIKPSLVLLLTRTFQQVHMQKELEQLAQRCQQAGWLERHATWEQRLASAAIHLALGAERVADQLLNAVRDRLYIPSDQSAEELAPRAYTELALMYASTLAFVSFHRRLGRYEELFQRLRPLHVHGSTNYFWTLQPLRLVDTLVCGVIGDIHQRGPKVQQWLDQEEARFRQRLYRDVQQALERW